MAALLDGRADGEDDADGEDGADGADGEDDAGVPVVAVLVAGSGEPAGAALPLWCAGDAHAATSRRLVRVPTKGVARMMNSWLIAAGLLS
ncbi:hypothetical protein ABZU25_19675 [Micromonospora sp. NPDC005215]|uniref:hypothetical protein n=1 Tax=Micromonospora sp. NPDC005215 TaxID=3157024 RepID=UPI0033A36704